MITASHLPTIFLTGNRTFSGVTDKPRIELMSAKYKAIDETRQDIVERLEQAKRDIQMAQATAREVEIELFRHDHWAFLGTVGKAFEDSSLTRKDIALVMRILQRDFSNLAYDKNWKI